MTKPRIWYLVKFPKAYRTRSYFEQDEKDAMDRWLKHVREKYGVRGKAIRVIEARSKLSDK